ncbi:unnamed protein product, partial [Symbiodinium sp. KB8]
MPRPEPPVRRHRYKPGKRERQERREQKAAEKAAWTAWKAAQPWRPRPVTVYGGARSSDSRDATVAWDAEPSESDEEVPLEAEHPDDMTGSPMARDQANEAPAKEEDTDSEETVLVEAEDPHAEDIAAEGADIPQPRTPPAAVTTDDQMDGASDLAMQNAQPGVAEADAKAESRGTSEPPQPGWLFSEETLQLAAAHGIQSAVVDGREVLLPRPKRRPATVRQTPAMDRTPCSEGIPDPSPDPSPVLNMAVSDMEGEAAQSEAVRPLPGGSDKRCSRWPGWKYSRPALNHDGSTRRWRTSLIAVNLRRPWSYNWRKLFREMNCTWQLLSTGTVHAAWRLACGYRHAFSRRRWPQIQAKLAGITGHPKCESIRRLIRAHQRLEERHRPLQSSAVRAYMLESATTTIDHIRSTDAQTIAENHAQCADSEDTEQDNQAPTRIHKRSYKRAVARAAQSQHGGTIYKGRWCTLRGLSQDLYVELLKALEAMPAQTQPQIVALQDESYMYASLQKDVVKPGEPKPPTTKFAN